MLIILSSIIYSNSQTNEIKKAMLLNNDIEELTKKVEIYYLKKETLPMVEDFQSKFKYWEEETNITPGDYDPVYYKLEISLLENLTLNNSEIINGNEQDGPQDGDQWYVINKETHTIYFVKYENGQVVLQKAKYSKKYEEIIAGATEIGIKFNAKPESDSADISDTIIGNTTEEPKEDYSGRYAGDTTGQSGTNRNPGETSGKGNYNSVFDYAGYTYGWTPGNKSDSLVLHYDGEYNTLSGNTISHSNNTSTWSDLSGYGNDGNIVNNTTWTIGFSFEKPNNGWSAATSGVDTPCTSYQYDGNNSGNRSSQNAAFESTSLELDGKKYVVCDKNDYSNIKMNGKVAYNNFSSIPTGSSTYTMEIVFKHKGNGKQGLMGMGTYNNAYHESSGDYGISGLKDWDIYHYEWRGPKIKYNINVIFKGVFGYEPYTADYSGTNLKSVIISDEANGKSNALRTNDNGNGITSYYWGTGDVDTGDISLSSGIHTVSVKYNGENTIIYIDGVEKKRENKIPNTLVNEITIGATNKQSKVICINNNSYTNGKLQFQFQYQELLNGNVYSARIYNKALADDEIKRNHYIDRQRFGF